MLAVGTHQTRLRPTENLFDQLQPAAFVGICGDWTLCPKDAAFRLLQDLATPDRPEETVLGNEELELT